MPPFYCERIMKVAAKYTRVSTSKQEEEATIETQNAEIRRLQETHKHPIVKEYTDVISGSEISRPGLNQLREDAKNGVFEVLYVYKLDRLARKLGIQIALFEEFEKYGVEVISSDGGRIEYTPDGMMNRNIRGMFAEYERYTIAKRFFDGKVAKVNNRMIIGCYPPYGYSYVKGEKSKDNHFEVDAREAGIVRLIFKTYLGKQSVYATARALDEMGIRSRGRNREAPTPFHKQTIRKILRNEVYIGKWYWGKTSMCEAKYHIKEARKSRSIGRKINDKETWKMVEVPAIIDKTDFDKVQQILSDRAKEYTRESKYFYLCQGLIRCVSCSRIYNGRRNGSKKYRTRKGTLLERKTLSFSYICAARYAVVGKKCYAPQISAKKLDNIIWDHVFSFISNPENVKKGMRNLWEKRNKDRAFNQKNLADLVAGRDSVRQQKQNLLKLYAKEKYSESDLDPAMESLDYQEKGFDMQIGETEAELQKVKDTEAVEKEIEKMCEWYYQLFSPEPTQRLQKFTVQRWVKEINLLEDGGIKIKCRVPGIADNIIKLNECPSQDTLPVY